MTSQSVLDFLTNKRVFVFDTETTGLPAKGPSGFGSYWDYRDNTKYESARIVSIAWAFMNCYNKNDEITKSFLTNINVAKEFLTKYLHPTILARCDLCTLSIEPESYIDEACEILIDSPFLTECLSRFIYYDVGIIDDPAALPLLKSECLESRRH